MLVFQLIVFRFQSKKGHQDRAAAQIFHMDEQDLQDKNLKSEFGRMKIRTGGTPVPLVSDGIRPSLLEHYHAEWIHFALCYFVGVG